MPKIKVAIDGPAGAGKSTVAKLVASELGYTYIDSGAMYRSVAYIASSQGVDISNVNALEQIASQIDITFNTKTSGAQTVIVNGEDVTEAIRTPEISALVSPVSAVSGVRLYMTAQQQAMGTRGGVVMEGRDIGTVVFPDAEAKIYLMATDEERARRRFSELTHKGIITTFEEVLASQRERDLRDSSRSVAPLKAAEDSIRLITDGMSIDEVVSKICQICRENGAD